MKKRMIAFLLLIFAMLFFSSCQRKETDGAVIVPDNEVGKNESTETGTPLQESLGHDRGKSEDLSEENKVSADESHKEDEITTKFDAKTGTLTVSGNGKAEELYAQGTDKTVKVIIIEEGIYEISGSFNGLSALKEIKFPSTLTDVISSFNKAVSLRELDLPANVLYMEDSFNSCKKLVDLQFNGPITLIKAFDGCAVETVDLPKFTKCEGSFAGCNKIKEIVIGLGVEVQDHSVVVDDSGWELGEGEADDFLHSPSFYCPDIEAIPKVYIYQPEWRRINLGLEEYFWVEVPEGENWEDYRDTPGEKIGG